jgi:hypothetical protein
MIRRHTNTSKLRPSPIGVATAAALYDPSLLMRLRIAQPHGEPPRPRDRSLVPADDVGVVYPGRIDVAGVTGAAALLTLLLSMRAIAGRRFRAPVNPTAGLTPSSVPTVVPPGIGCAR